MRLAVVVALETFRADARNLGITDLQLIVLVSEYYVISIGAHQVISGIDVAHIGFPITADHTRARCLPYDDLRSVGQFAYDLNIAVLIARLIQIKVFLLAAVCIVIDYRRTAHLNVGVTCEEYRVLIVVLYLIIDELTVLKDKCSAALGVNT